jgi:hypothetical protein
MNKKACIPIVALLVGLFCSNDGFCEDAVVSTIAASATNAASTDPERLPDKNKRKRKRSGKQLAARPPIGRVIQQNLTAPSLGAAVVSCTEKKNNRGGPNSSIGRTGGRIGASRGPLHSTDDVKENFYNLLPQPHALLRNPDEVKSVARIPGSSVVGDPSDIVRELQNR